MLLEQINRFGFVDEELDGEYKDLFEQLNNILDRLTNQLDEDLGMPSAPTQQKSTGTPATGMADDSVGTDPDEIISALDTAIKQMEAAKRGLGIVNGMGDSAFRTKNRSRVMGNMNKIRASLKRVDGLLAQAEETNSGDIDAAKSDMGDINKMPDSPERTTSRSRLMGGLNRLRGAANRLGQARSRA